MFIQTLSKSWLSKPITRSTLEISMKKSLLKMVSFSRGQETLYPQDKEKTCWSRFMQVILVYLNAYMGPKRLYIGLNFMIKSMSLSQIVKHAENSLNNNKQPPSKYLGHEVPLVHWSKHATNILHFENSPYLLVVDYYSQLPVIRKLHWMTAGHITRHT